MMEIGCKDKSRNDIFTADDFNDMGRRVYWALISVFFGLTLGLLLNLNIVIIFIITLGVGMMNPDDRVKGRFP
jgi:hypothetical protein